MRKGVGRFFLLVILFEFAVIARAQDDTTHKKSVEDIISRQKGMIGQLAQNLIKNAPSEGQAVLRTEEFFQYYSGRTIRNIIVRTLEFGYTVDTLTNKDDKLKDIKWLANKLHWQTREKVIRNNLFFSRNDKLYPTLLSDNEKHLRDLPYIRDARFLIKPVEGTSDSVDIFVLSKDVLSIGGSLVIENEESASISVKEDNLLGLGDRLEFSALYDMRRDKNFGEGVQYIKRNIGGSFIDIAAGFLNFNKAINDGEKQERMSYIRLVRPLVSRYMRWTYGASIEWRKTENQYNTDSLYLQDLRYRFNIIDGWGAWNIDADKIDRPNNIHNRRLIGLRILQQDFFDKPLKYTNEYFYRYADVFAVLGSISMFRQTFYKTQYIYGFGRNEDVPDGMEASVTGGWTRKNDRRRMYLGVDLQRYFFTKTQHYLDFTIRAGTFFLQDNLEDINILAGIDYFTRLHQLGKKWKQRFFMNFSAARQINTLLNEPLKLESEYGLPELSSSQAYGELYGDTRVTMKMESVFFTPWSVLLFRFAPFVFANASYFDATNIDLQKSKLYSSVGIGLRVRNESLIFETVEFRGMYFPDNYLQKSNWGFEISTNVRFKYNQDFIKRPEFTSVN
jgi:hypothetical protein